MRFQTTVALAFVLLSSQPSLAQSEAWEPYRDPEFGFTALLPTHTFAPVVDSDRPGLTLRSLNETAQINVYGGPAGDLGREALETRLAAGDQVREITYRTGGESWFVLSGFYEPLANGEPVIFYTKVLFSQTQDSFSAFEISFPESEKPRYEATVEYFEDNFTRPTS
jgi:hypothetical protein